VTKVRGGDLHGEVALPLGLRFQTLWPWRAESLDGLALLTNGRWRQVQKVGYLHQLSIGEFRRGRCPAFRESLPEWQWHTGRVKGAWSGPNGRPILIHCHATGARWCDGIPADLLAPLELLLHRPQTEHPEFYTPNVKIYSLMSVFSEEHPFVYLHRLPLLAAAAAPGWKKREYCSGPPVF